MVSNKENKIGNESCCDFSEGCAVTELETLTDATELQNSALCHPSHAIELRETDEPLSS